MWSLVLDDYNEIFLIETNELTALAFLKESVRLYITTSHLLDGSIKVWSNKNKDLSGAMHASCLMPDEVVNIVCYKYERNGTLFMTKDQPLFEHNYHIYPMSVVRDAFIRKVYRLTFV